MNPVNKIHGKYRLIASVSILLIGLIVGGSGVGIAAVDSTDTDTAANEMSQIGDEAITTAATNASVSITPANETVDVGDTVSFAVMLDPVDNGVASYEFDATLNNSNVANITDVSLQGTSSDDTLTAVEYAKDNSSVAVAAGSAGHENGTVATITVQTTAAGTASLSLSNVAVGDADGNSYDINSINGGTITALKQSVAVGFSSANKTIAEGNNASVGVIVSNATSGVNSYSFEASITDTSAATIGDVSLVGTDRSDPLTNVTVADDGSTVSVTVGAGEIDNKRIATLRIRGQSIAEATLSLEAATIGDANATSYTISSLGTAGIQVKSPPEPVTGDNGPSDTDQDGTFEDMNGDGKFNIVDVSAAFQNRNSPTVQENLDFFDYNNDGKFNIIDVSALLKML